MAEEQIVEQDQPQTVAEVRQSVAALRDQKRMEQQAEYGRALRALVMTTAEFLVDDPANSFAGKVGMRARRLVTLAKAAAQKLAGQQGPQLVALADKYGLRDEVVAGHLHVALVTEMNSLLQSDVRMAPVREKAEAAAAAFAESVGTDDAPGWAITEQADLDRRKGVVHDEALRMETALAQLEEFDTMARSMTRKQ
ncbi:MAG: hypothetical protein ACYSUF_00385 [Planctomycetota bacterium]